MSAARFTLRLVLGLLLAAATGCASTPVAGAKNLVVSFHDFRSGQVLTLANEDNPTYANLYSQPRDRATVKLAPRETLEELLDYADGEDFFEHAQALERGAAADPPVTMREGAVGLIAVSADERDYGFLFRYGLGHQDKEAVQAFTNVQSRIVEVYNSIPSLQYISSGAAKDGNYFERERERLQRENADAVRRKRGSR